MYPATCGMYVIDTSVVVKWFVEEKDSNIALEILEYYRLGKFTIIVPDLLVYEFVNVLRYNKSFNRSEKKECIDILYDLDLYFVSPYKTLIENAEKIAEEKDITAYDSIFIALAEEIKCKFITADEKLFRKVSRLPFVNLLSNIDISNLLNY